MLPAGGPAGGCPAALNNRRKQLPTAEKFDPVSFERLRLGEPQLKDPKAWQQFERDVIAKEFKSLEG